MTTQKQIFKVGIYKEETQETLYSQIVEFVIWGEGKYKSLFIQGLQSIECNIVFMSADGIIQIHIDENKTLEFEFQGGNSSSGWVTAKVTHKY